MTQAAKHERLALDTSAYAHMRRGNPAVLDRVAGASVVIISAIVLGELEAGFLLGNKQKANQQALVDFLAEPFVVIVEVTQSVSRHYARIFTQLRRRGTPIPTNDVWIAASTMSTDAHLLTFDSDFDRIDDLPRTVLPVT